MTKIKIEIKSRWTGSIIFEYEKENNTIKETLEEAVKAGASLDGASLDGASLDGASLDGASLDGASLDGASLVGASLVGADLEPIKNDLFAVLLPAISEISTLKAAIQNGEIDGSVYSGCCCCLNGTLCKNASIEVYNRLKKIRRASRPIEKFFAAIKPGDTPENSQFCKIAMEWIEEFEMYIQPPTTV